MNATPTATDPVRRRRLVWVSIVAGGAVVALIAAVVSARVAADRERSERDAAEPTAWENRAAMDQVLVDTALLLGIEGEVQPEREAPLVCVRRDGRQGVSYLLHEVRGGPLDDPQSALEEAARSWTDAGYAVSDVASVSEVWRLSAETQDGAPISLGTGPGGTVLTGETGCFLRDGAPEAP